MSYEEIMGLTALLLAYAFGLGPGVVIGLLLGRLRRREEPACHIGFRRP